MGIVDRFFQAAEDRWYDIGNRWYKWNARRNLRTDRARGAVPVSDTRDRGLWGPGVDSRAVQSGRYPWNWGRFCAGFCCKWDPEELACRSEYQAEIKVIKERDAETNGVVRRNVKRHVKKWIGKYAQPEPYNHPFALRLAIDLGREPLDSMYHNKCLERLQRYFGGEMTVVEFANKLKGIFLDSALRAEGVSCFRELSPAGRANMGIVGKRLGELRMNPSAEVVLALCVEARVDVPILKPTSAEEQMHLSCKIITGSIALRLQIDREKDVLRTDEVLRLGSDAMTRTELGLWRDMTASRENYYQGVDARVNPVPPAMQA